MHQVGRDSARSEWRARWREGLLLLPALVLACGPAQSGPEPTGVPPAKPGSPDEKVSWSASAVKRGVLAGEYRIRAADEEFLAVNRAADLRARWSRNGLSAWRSRAGDRPVKAPEVSLKTVSIGREETARVLGDGELSLGDCRSDGEKDERGVCLQRLERELNGLKEWWENREDGLAHGFVLDRAPADPGGRSGWLRVKVRVAGARIELETDGRGATLIGNRQRFRYSGLAAWDADQKSLPTRMGRAGSHLLLDVDDRGARYPLVIDPVLTLSTWAYESNQTTSPPDSAAGLDMVVAGALDVNGDTHQDVLVGFPRYNSATGNNSGIVYLFLGTPTGPSLTPAWSSEGTNIANTAAGPTAGALFGRSIAAGRINGDAFADVVVGQVGWGNGEALEGRVYVFFGQAGASPLPAVANQVLEGRSVNAFFGRAVALGNLDGANGDDLVVGSSGFNANAGRVELYLADAAGAFPADVSPSDTLLGVAGSSLGESVAAGDTNADGRADVHAAARTWTYNRDEGALYSMLTDGAGRLGVPFVFVKSVQHGQLGRVAFAGDVNGDGFGDVVAGAPSVVYAFQSTVYVLYGSSGGITATGHSEIVDSCVERAPAIDFCTYRGSTLFGGTVAGPADVDNDGFFDVIAGAPAWNPNLILGAPAGTAGQGAVFVIRGSAAGPVTTNPYLLDPDSVFFGEAAGDALGSALAVAGDVNKDGFADLLAGAGGFEDGAEVDEGKAVLFLGGAPSAKTTGQVCVLNGECQSGFCVDGFCCNTICGGIPGVEADAARDCQACSLATSGAPNGICTAAPISTPCDSTNLCLVSAVCDDSGSCIGGVPRVCPPSSDPCVDSGVCDPTTGMCNPRRLDGTSCGDANACTLATTCQAGVCTPGMTVTCPAPAICKLAGACNPATGTCEYADAAEGTACNDMNLCTAGESCRAGACVTTPAMTCGAESACKNAGSCDPGTGVCAQTNKPDDTACDDGDLCTIDDVCVAGACSPGAVRNCDDGDPCTADSCLPASGCVHASMCPPDAAPTSDARPADARDGPPADLRDAPPRDSASDTRADRTPDTAPRGCRP